MARADEEGSETPGSESYHSPGHRPGQVEVSIGKKTIPWPSESLGPREGKL